MDSKLLILVALCLLPSAISEEEIWEKEMGKEVYIEASVDGLKAVHLKCFDDKMRVNVELEESGFDGVIYTRGSFKAGKKPCFYDAKGVENEKFTLEWTFEQCKTETRGDKKTNEIIVQQDDMLIFPGDMAFELICKGQEATIGLADPDPGAKPLPRKRRKPVTGSNGEVTFTPEHVLKQKSEL